MANGDSANGAASVARKGLYVAIGSLVLTAVGMFAAYFIGKQSTAVEYEHRFTALEVEVQAARHKAAVDCAEAAQIAADEAVASALKNLGLTPRPPVHRHPKMRPSPEGYNFAGKYFEPWLNVTKADSLNVERF